MEWFRLEALQHMPVEMMDSSSGDCLISVAQAAGEWSEFFREMLQMRSLGPQPMLLLCTDEGSGNRLLAKFLERQGLQVQWAKDPCHRAWNDIQAMLRSTGAHSTYLLSIVPLNLQYGPWTSRTFFSEIQHKLAELIEYADADDEHVLFHWDAIRTDHMGSTSTPSLELAADRSGRERWLQEVAEARPLQRLGTKVSTSRWFTWQQAMAERGQWHHTLCLVYGRLAMDRGTLKSLDDLVLPASARVTENQRAAASSSSAKSVKGVASSSDAPAPEMGTATAEAAGEDTAGQQRQQLQRLRARTKNTILLAAQVLADPSVTAITRMIAAVTKPMHDLYTSMTRSFSNPESMEQWLMQRVGGSYFDDLQKIMAAHRDSSTVTRIGIAVEIGTVNRLKEQPDSTWQCGFQDELVEQLMAMTTCMVQTRLQTEMLWSHTYPNKLLALLSKEWSVRAEAMHSFKEHILALSAASTTLPGAKKELMEGSCLASAWMQLLVSRAASSGWVADNTHVLHMVRSWARAWQQSKINEDANQKMRDTEARRSSNKGPDKCALWRAVAQSELVETYGRSSLPHALATKSHRPQDLTDLFDPKLLQAKSGATVAVERPSAAWEEHLRWNESCQELLKPGMDGLGGSHARDVSHMLHELVAAKVMREGTPQMWDQRWMSALLPEQQLVREVESESYYLIQFVSEFGACAFRACIADGEVSCTYSRSALVVLICSDLSKWEVVASKWSSPLSNAMAGRKASLSRVVVDEPCTSLLQWHSWNGFPGTTDSTLRKLQTHLGVVSPEPSKLHHMNPRHALIFSLIHHVAGDMSEMEALHALERARVIEKPLLDYAQTINETALDDVVLEQDREEMKKDVAEAKLQRANADEERKTTPQAVRAWSWGSGVRRPDAVKSTRTSRPEYLAEENEQKMRTWMSMYQPSKAQTCLDMSNARWQIAYRVHGKMIRKSFSWRKRGLSSCLSEALAWLWEQAKIDSGAVPPWKP